MFHGAFVVLKRNTCPEVFPSSDISKLTDMPTSLPCLPSVPRLDQLPPRAVCLKPALARNQGGGKGVMRSAGHYLYIALPQTSMSYACPR